MKLNELRMHQTEPAGVENMDEDEDEAISISFDSFNESFEPPQSLNKSIKPPLKSKWSEFLDKIEESNEDDDEPEFGNNFTWEMNSNKRKKNKNDSDVIQSKEIYINNDDDSFNYENNENENKTDFKRVKKEVVNVRKRELNVCSKWSKYSEYLENDSEEFEEPKPKKVLTTFNQISDDNLDEILDL